MLIVGLTGGMGAGKSTVANLFAQLNVPIIDADLIARELSLKAPFFDQIVARFPSIQKNDTFDRLALRNIIFTQPREKQWLEQLLHPAIHQAIIRFIEHIDFAYGIVMVPLLAEHWNTYQALINQVIVVEAPLKERLKRIAQRDNISLHLIKKMINAQASSHSRSLIATYRLINKGDLIDLQNKVQALHQLFLNQA